MDKTPRMLSFIQGLCGWYQRASKEQKRGQEATDVVCRADSLEEVGLILATQPGGLAQVKRSREDI